MNFSSGNITDNSSSITSSSSNTSSTESAILPIVPTPDDIIVGVAMTVSSVLCIIPNVVVLKLIYSDKELYRLNAYKFMILLGYFDISQLVVHAITGFFNMFQSVGAYWFAKALGVIATPSYVAYAILTIILAFNRFIQITFPGLDEILFSPKFMKVWYGVAISGFCLFALALVSPWASIIYLPEWWSWSYDYNLPNSQTVQDFEKVVEIGGIPIAGILYLLVFILLIKKRKQFKVSRNYITEVKVLIQAVIITIYCSILNCFWHDLFKVPPTKEAYMALNFMWIFNGAVNPVVYFILNAYALSLAYFNILYKF
uniref:G-protein coupled receptors family 1 profile domain-containing protein n=1 Tax=Acrobeloides nanus TaxID=290746 RepID=A0A914DKI5_9BILA